jgi:hypothetical protein
MRIIAMAAVLAGTVLQGCTTTREATQPDYAAPAPPYSLVVLPPEVIVGQVNAMGRVEPRDSWTAASRDNLVAAFKLRPVPSGTRVTVLAGMDQAGADQELLAKLAPIFDAVGHTVLDHVSGRGLPTKPAGRLDWSLGPLAVEYGRRTGFDYALFLHAEDSFVGNSRVAVQAVTMAATCVVGVCLVPGGGAQIAFASLVDLRSGELVWFKRLLSDDGDIRTPEGAAQMLERLLDDLFPDSEASR